LARDGPAALYAGDLGAQIARYLRAEGGLLDSADLAAYRVDIRPAMRSTYRGMDVYTSGRDSGGGVLAPVLGRLERLDLASLEPLGAERMAAVIEATGQVWSERLGSTTVTADSGCTDHLVVADRRGNVVSVTTTLQMLMGSGVTVPGTGIVLNNGMCLFDERPGRPNSLAPGKKAITNMCPTVVLRDGQPVVAIGASGGRRIPSMIVQPLTLMLDHGWPGDRALAAPRYQYTGSGPLLVEDALPEPTLAALRERGYRVEVRPWDGTDLGGQAPCVWFEPGGQLFGAPDPRRHGGAVAW
jgi:gamma-glutamyltranspeptidase/glutathione hydrolase